MSVTFHRAFDETPDLNEALESVILTGADSLLTSGGEADVLAGANSLASLVQQAGDRIRIIAGGGLRLETLLEVTRRTGVSALHGSLTRIDGDDSCMSSALETDVRAAVSLLRSEFEADLRPGRKFNPTATHGKSSSGSATGLQ
jgi:copper homeostasis protein